MTTRELFENLLQGKKMRLKRWEDSHYIFLNKNGMLVETLDNGYSLETATIHFVDDNWQEYKEEILDKEEKEYLEAVLRPFKDKFKYIQKLSSHTYEQQQYILITLKTGPSIDFPYFEENTMYQGMEVDRKYTLKDLGLFDRKIF